MMAPKGYDLFSTLSPEQSNIFNLLSNLYQKRLGGEGAETFAAPVKRQFEEQIVPGLAERFSGLGSGAQSSSAFSQALGTAGADLSERLAAMAGQREDSALGGLQNLLGMNTQGLIPKQRGFGESLLSGLGSSAPQLIKLLSSLLLGM